MTHTPLPTYTLHYECLTCGTARVQYQHGLSPVDTLLAGVDHEILGGNSSAEVQRRRVREAHTLPIRVTCQGTYQLMAATSENYSSLRTDYLDTYLAAYRGTEVSA